MSRVFRSVVRNVCSLNKNFGSVRQQSERLVSSASRSSVGKMLFVNRGLVPMSRHLHTENDATLAKFLKTEIASELKELSESGNKVKDFVVEKVNEDTVTLKRKFNDERLTVTFSLNNTLDELEHGHEEVELVSRPDFTFVMDKGGDKVLSIECGFYTPETEEHDESEHYEKDHDDSQEHPVRIYSVVMENASKDVGSSYTLTGDMMDSTMYELLLKMLEERGIDEEFMLNLGTFATRCEKGLYVKLLEELKKFVSK